MLTTNKIKLFQDIVGTCSNEELVWLNEYLNGIIGLKQERAVKNEVSQTTGKITIAYGTETGNTKKLALDFAAKAKKLGVHAKLVSLDQYRLSDLVKEEYFFTLISTQGEGEPPAAAKKFYDHIHQNGFKLEKMKFGVLALGDTAYPLFCKAGEDVDAQFQKLGAERIVSLQKCDLDFGEQAGNWFAEVLHQIGTHITPVPQKPEISKKSNHKKIYFGKILVNVDLNDRGSAKHTHHIEIEADSIEYEPGDSIGIVPENPADIVEAIISVTGIDPNKELSFRNANYSYFELLKTKLNIVYLPKRVVAKYASIVQQIIPDTKISLMDLLKIYPVRDCAQFEEILKILEPLSPRLYSISSSPLAHDGELHITVAKDTFLSEGETRHGLCSSMLAQVLPEAIVPFYVHKNAKFKLPAPEKDMIMIGPGTGIAPFRSFLAQRDASGATGRNWLFFGDQHFATDFLYQTELLNWVQTGVLTRLNVAFSRDQKEKKYVQHKMMDNGLELLRWLQSGASLFICGSKNPMASDVEHALINIFQKFGGMDDHCARQYLDALKEAERYLTDVY